MVGKHVVVVVLGDLGRSPRMQYHSQSLSQLKEVSRVTILGYDGERCMKATEMDRKIVQCRLNVPEFGSVLRRLSLVHALLKGLYILFSILRALMSLPSYDVILIQNPPALPALVAALLADALVLFFRPSVHIILDWHNLGFSMFEEKVGKEAAVVYVSRFLEKALARRAHSHMCVSKAMSRWLLDNFGIEATVLYDRPNSSFKKEPPSILQRHVLLHKLGFTPQELFGFGFGLSAAGEEKEADGAGEYTQVTVHTQQAFSMSAEYGMVGKEPTLLSGEMGRIPLIISSTSWTPDEDFDIFLDALLDLNKNLVLVEQKQEWAQEQRGKDSPTTRGMRVLVVVTGKGPTKQAFLDRVAALSQPQAADAEGGRRSEGGSDSSNSLLSHVCIKTVWLEPEDYPLLMRCADVGVCLHTSTSGLDLPMKVLDMFGSSLPVCAVNFPTLPELVKDGENGYIFEASEPKALSKYLFSLLSCGQAASFPSSAYTQMKKKAGELAGWDSNWTESVGPMMRTILERKSAASVNSMALRLAVQSISLFILYLCAWALFTCFNLIIIVITHV